MKQYKKYTVCNRCFYYTDNLKLFVNGGFCVCCGYNSSSKDYPKNSKNGIAEIIVALHKYSFESYVTKKHKTERILLKNIQLVDSDGEILYTYSLMENNTTFRFIASGDYYHYDLEKL